MSPATLSLVVNAIYLALLAQALLISYLVPARQAVPAPQTEVLGATFVAISIADYLIGLWLEARQLKLDYLRAGLETGRIADPRAAVSQAAIVAAALGATPAIYAVVGHLIGVRANPWFWLTWATALVAFLHQRYRWERYEETLRRFYG